MAIINKPNDFFNTLLYSGNNTNNTSITGVGFEPDLTWIKNRNSSGNNCLFTQMTGLDVAGYLASNSANAFASDATLFKSFNSDGYTIGTGGNVNDSGRTYCSWNWKAGTSFSNSAGANGASIASTGNINTTAGISMITYTGNGASSATLAHGLAAVPKMMFVKRRDASASWFVYHQILGANNQLKLDNQEASSANQGAWNNTTPTSSLFTIGTADSVNANNGTYINYLFSEIPGYSKIDKYTGNGVADGPIVNCGFKPAFVLVKITTANNENWMLLDNKRDGFNTQNDQLFPNTNDDEEANTEADFLSNGFKLTRANSRMNGAAGNYIFMAFAENPFVTSTGNGSIPTTAR